jgi:hypothetical protein
LFRINSGVIVAPLQLAKYNVSVREAYQAAKGAFEDMRGQTALDKALRK